MKNMKKNKIVQEWLEKTKGLKRTIATEEGTRPITEQELRSLVDKCEWAKISDDSDLSVMSGIYPESLIIGSGDLLDYCTSGGKSKSSHAEFLYAY